MPYDQFVKWQLAGDELATEDPLAWMATGFLGAGAFPTQLTEAEFESARYDELDDMVSTTGVAFLGLSIGCARCHDHKFRSHYFSRVYQFAAVFSSVIRAEKSFDLDPEANRHARTRMRKSFEKSGTSCRRCKRRYHNAWPDGSKRREIIKRSRTTGKFGQARSSLKTNRSISCRR